MSQTIKYAHVKNFKGIKDVEVKNPSRFVAIFGRNGAGKTSFLDAIKNAIKLEKWGNSKVTVWEKNGEIEIHFDDFKIKRIIGEKGKLEVEHNGELVQRPQEWLDSIFLWTIGDPQKFLSLQRKEKIRYILETHGKKEKFDALEEEREQVFSKRQDIHKRTLAKEEEIKHVDTEDFDKIEEIEDVSQYEAELKKAEEHNQTYYELEKREQTGASFLNEIVKEIEVKRTAIKDDRKRIKELQEQIDALKEWIWGKSNSIKELQEKENKAKSKLDEIKKEIQDFEKKDTDEIKQKIQSVYAKREAVASIKTKKEMYEADVQKASELRQERKELDRQVKDIEDKQNDLIKEIGISYDMKVEDWVMSVKVDDVRVPLDDLNTAAQLDLWVDICLNWPNKIKIITIENANALDPNTMERIKKKIENKQGQCFLETVYQVDYDTITVQDWQVVE